MKSYKKYLLLFCMFGILILTGCGIEVSTDLSLNQKFCGSRTMTCFVSQSDIIQYFQGDLSKIDNLLENNCPDCLDYKKKEVKNGYEFTFRLSFQSLDEYKTAVGSLLHFSPKISFYGSDSIFSKGLKISENFTSIDLLHWFEVLLRDEYGIKEDKLESLWEMTSTKVHFSDTVYESTEEKIHINSVEYAAFDGIDIYTEELDDRTYKRLIRFQIPSSTLKQHETELGNFFASRLPENATAFWIPTKTGKNYEVTIYSDSFRTLSEQTAKALNCNDYQATVSAKFADYRFLQFDLERMERLDFSYFLCTEDGEVPVTYYYKPNSITKIDIKEIKKRINNDFDGQPSKDGYYCLFDSTCTTLNIGFLGKMTLPVSSYKINTVLKEKGEIERTFLFYFKNSLRENEIKQLKAFFEKNNTSRLQMSGSFESARGSFTIVQTGTKDSLNHSSRLLFGNENNNIDYKRAHSIFALYQDTSLVEKIDLSLFLGEENKQIPGSYEFVLDSSETLKKFSITSERSDISYQDTNKNNRYQASISGSSFTAAYNGSTFHPLGLATFLILSGLFIGIGWVLIRRNSSIKQ